MGTCYLHIGPHKAASSYLQSSISCNLELLAAEKISVPRLGKGHITLPHHNLAHELSQHRKFSGEAGTFQDLRNFLTSHQPRDILISSEAFEKIAQDGEKSEFLKEFFHSLDYELHVLAVVRPQTDLINSAYTEQIKRFRHRKAFPEFVDWALQHPRAKYDMNANFEHWMKNFRCDFIPLNDDVIEKGLARVFFQKLGFADNRLAQLRTAPAANQSPGPKTIEAARMIRRVLDGLGGTGLNAGNLGGALQLRKTLIRKSEKAGWNKTKFYGFDDELFECVIDHFSESNDRFSRDVFGHPWLEVFQERRKPRNVFSFDKAKPCEKAQIVDLVKEVIYSMHKA